MCCYRWIQFCQKIKTINSIQIYFLGYFMHISSLFCLCIFFYYFPFTYFGNESVYSNGIFVHFQYHIKSFHHIVWHLYWKWSIFFGFLWNDHLFMQYPQIEIWLNYLKILYVCNMNLQIESYCVSDISSGISNQVAFIFAL